MDIDEMEKEATRERDELVVRIEALRRQRKQVNADIKTTVAELTRANRLVRAFNGKAPRKRTPKVQDGEHG